MIRDDSKCSDFYIGGFARLSSSLKLYSCVVALASYVADSFLYELLQDDRVLRRIDLFRDVMTDELRWLSGLHESIFVRLSKITGSDDLGPVGLRTAVMHAGMVSASFTTHRVLRVATSVPWSLAIGDIKANLSVLSEAVDMPRETVAGKIWCLLRSGSHNGSWSGLGFIIICNFQISIETSGHGLFDVDILCVQDVL
jgi:hypothetical protein